MGNVKNAMQKSPWIAKCQMETMRADWLGQIGLTLRTALGVEGLK